MYLVTRCRWGWLKNLLIRLVIRLYRVDMTEAAEPNPARYSSFNDFFTRALSPNARPLPAEGHHGDRQRPFDALGDFDGQGLCRHLPAQYQDGDQGLVHRDLVFQSGSKTRVSSRKDSNNFPLGTGNGDALYTAASTERSKRSLPLLATTRTLPGTTSPPGISLTCTTQESC